MRFESGDFDYFTDVEAFLNNVECLLCISGMQNELLLCAKPLAILELRWFVLSFIKALMF